MFKISIQLLTLKNGNNCQNIKILYQKFVVPNDLQVSGHENLVDTKPVIKIHKNYLKK